MRIFEDRPEPMYTIEFTRSEMQELYNFLNRTRPRTGCADTLFYRLYNEFGFRYGGATRNEEGEIS